MTAKRSRPTGEGMGGHPNTYNVHPHWFHIEGLARSVIPFAVCARPQCEAAIPLNPDIPLSEALRRIETFGWILDRTDHGSSEVGSPETLTYCSTQCVCSITSPFAAGAA